MQHRTADKLDYAKETLYLQAKLQHASWKPDVVAHEETDSGSDEEQKDLTEDIHSERMRLLLIQ